MENNRRVMASARAVLAMFVLVVFTGASVSARVQEPAPALTPSVVVFRIFMKDGRTLASYGEYACVGDRIIFSLAVGDLGSTALPLVSVPLSSVDVGRTEQYAEAVRGAQFAASRGPREYEALTTEVSKAVEAVYRMPDAGARLVLAQNIRAKLVTWAAASHGYRAGDVRNLVQMVDDIISQLRAALGLSEFSFDLVSGVPEPVQVPLAPAPSLRESIEMALGAAEVVDPGAERLGVLRAALQASAGLPASDPRDGEATLTARVQRTLAEETATEHAYANLIADALGQATAAAHAGDVRAILALRDRVFARDHVLGGRRPADLASIMTTIDDTLKAAQLQRLALDHWDATHDSIEAYRVKIVKVLNDIMALTPVLDAVRDLAGTPVSRLVSGEQRLIDLGATVDHITPPADLRPVHDLLASALQMARQACALRRRAVLGNDIGTAHDASAAAVGAQMLVARAREELTAHLRPPDVK